MVSLTSRDMLKLGSVVLNEGMWDGEQFISSDYLEKATSGLVDPTQDWMPAEYRYGYFWYQTNILVAGNNYDVRFAWGGGGQGQLSLNVDALGITGQDRTALASAVQTTRAIISEHG